MSVMTRPYHVSAFVSLARPEHPTFAYVNQPWMEQALCAQTDPETFFPEKGQENRTAKKMCASCDVRGECLEFALATDQQHGVWGGLSVSERRKLSRPTTPIVGTIPCTGCLLFFVTDLGRKRHALRAHPESS